MEKGGKRGGTVVNEGRWRKEKEGQAATVVNEGVEKGGKGGGDGGE